MDVMERVCTGSTVYRGYMDVMERVCTGSTVYRGYMDVMERVLTKYYSSSSHSY